MGGIILAVLLGPAAAFMTMASVLTVQALFFADGGLLALGCNIFNLGFFPSYVAYPLLFKPIAGGRPGVGRLAAASLVSSVAGLQLGAFGVVAETWASGNSELPLSTFLMVMQPIHLIIGIAEGLVTAAVISFVWKARPELMGNAPPHGSSGGLSPGKILGVFGVMALLSAGIFSLFASVKPDGLEWSISRVIGNREMVRDGGAVHESLAKIQERTAVLPDYGFREPQETSGTGPATAGKGGTAQKRVGGDGDAAPPEARRGKSGAGILGGAVTLLLAAGVGLALKSRKREAGA